jgi:hypothetical protein
MFIIFYVVVDSCHPHVAVLKNVIQDTLLKQMPQTNFDQML